MDGARAVGGQRDALCKFDRGRRPGEERLRVQHALRFVAQGGEEEEHGACEVALVHIFVEVLEYLLPDLDGEEDVAARCYQCRRLGLPTLPFALRFPTFLGLETSTVQRCLLRRSEFEVTHFLRH